MPPLTVCFIWYILMSLFLFVHFIHYDRGIQEAARWTPICLCWVTRISREFQRREQLSSQTSPKTQLWAQPRTRQQKQKEVKSLKCICIQGISVSLVILMCVNSSLFAHVSIYAVVSLSLVIFDSIFLLKSPLGTDNASYNYVMVYDIMYTVCLCICPYSILNK